MKLGMTEDNPTITVACSCRDLAPTQAAVRAVVRKVLALYGVGSAEIDIAIVGDRRMRGLNRRYAGHDRVTDVLSFDLTDDADEDKLHAQIITNWGCHP